MEVNPEVDVPHLIKYGKERGVGIILWAAWAQFLGREEQVVAHYAKMGAAGFKIDFMDRDDQVVVNFLASSLYFTPRNAPPFDFNLCTTILPSCYCW